MANLGIAGAFSLQTMNQWISVINTNLTNSKRIGYKETRVSFSAGEVSSIGSVQTSGQSSSISFPSASLEIGKTQILDYVQGNLTQTGQIADFALNGKGYFVVEDKNGDRYATRDGQFNFDTEGYLVTAEGLRVLTTGMDYFRVPASENFNVNSQGESESNSTSLTSNMGTTFNPASGANPAEGVSSFSNSIYGNRKLLVIDIPTENNLIYSKYGYTKFQLGPRIPITIKNDFSETMDGINPYLVSETMNQYFKHDVRNGTIKMSTHAINGTQNRYVQAAISSQQYTNVSLAVDFHIRDGNIQNTTNETTFGITFGKSELTSTDANAYFIGIKGTQLVLEKNGVNVASSASFNGFLPADPPNSDTLDPANKLTIKLEVTDGLINAQLYRGGAVIASLPVTPRQTEYKGGYIGIGTTVNNPTFGTLVGNSGGIDDNVIDITSIDVVDHSTGNSNVLQKNLSNKDDVIVMQQYVEESTSTLADTLPMLSTAQKMFGAVSKIISVYNSMTDDTNALLR